VDSQREAPATSPLVDALVELSFAVQAVLTRTAASYNLSVTQLRLLGILRDRTPPMTAIAEHLGLDRSSVTGLVDRAEQRRLVARTPSSDDARVIMVQLTPTGRAIGRQIGADVSVAIEELLEEVPSELRDGLVRVAATVLGDTADRRLQPTERARPPAGRDRSVLTTGSLFGMDGWPDGRAPEPQRCEGPVRGSPRNGRFGHD
jgi:DNA-binding MarR family transcriptional regulator